MEDKYKTKKLSLREIFDDLTDEEFDELMEQWDEKGCTRYSPIKTTWPIPPAPPLPSPKDQ